MELQVALFGECMVELRGQPFGAMEQGFGGDTLNAAVYLARRAAPGRLGVAYASALGDDPYSDGMLERWRAEGIALDLVRRIAGRLPGLYTIAVDGRGERSFHYWRDTSAARSYFDADTTPLEQAAPRLDALMVSGISVAILPDAGRARLWALMDALRARGATTVFDNNYRPRLWPDAQAARRAHAATLARTDIALLTEDDEIALHGDAAPERLWALPCREVVIKRGAAPVRLRVHGSEPLDIPVPAVTRVVDTTAAGDAFAGAYLAARLSGGDAIAAVQAGIRLAGRVIQHPGAIIGRAAMADLLG